jgi:hypothetical protein
MLQPTLWAELDFIRQVCPLTPEQRPKIKAAGEEGLKQAARHIGLPQQRVISNRASGTQMAAARTIRAALSKALEEALPQEEFEKYSEEALHRTNHRKQAAILNVVARLDALLCFSAEQREKLVDTLSTSWQDEWEQWLMLHQYGGQYFPQIPEQHVLPHLNDEPKSVWRGVQKISVNAWSSVGRPRANDGWWEAKK